MSVPPSSTMLSTTTSFATILDDHFSAAMSNGEFTFLSALKKLHAGPNTLHVALVDSVFPLSAFLLTLGIKVELLDEPRHELVSWTSNTSGLHHAAKFRGRMWLDPFDEADKDTKGGLSSRLISGIMKFKYKDVNFLVYKIGWYQERGHRLMYDFIFDAPESVVREVKDNASIKSAGHELISDIYRWSQALKNEIWVFQEGVWKKDAALWAAISCASWDDIVLEQEFLEGLRRDTRTFFENRSIYRDLGVVWKRGILLLGPPGNGKTESIKVLLKETGQAALYVKSFTTPMGPENGVRSIFDHARANAPCILVIEDLDSLVTPNVRSFFLNELDGLSQNEGILTIATTNHPERIDDAILNRPSRFDVKYNFGLPAESLRTTYALKWIRKITSLHDSAGSAEGRTGVKFDRDEADLAEEVSRKTEGWSFAFLKELFISFLLRIAHDKTRDLASGRSSANTASADSVLLEQITSLSSQILNVDDKSDETTDQRMSFGSRTRLATPALPVIAAAHRGTNF